MQITPYHLAFLEEAKAAFEGNKRFETYRNKDGDLIALRMGEDRDCVEIIELGRQVAFFAQIMDKAPELIVTTEREEVLWFAAEMEKQLKANDHKSGWISCSEEFLKSELEKNFIRISQTCTSSVEYQRKCVNIANFAMMLADKDRQL